MQEESGIVVEEPKEEIQETIQDEPQVVPQDEQLNEFMRKRFMESSEILLAIDAYYIKYLDKHQDGMAERLEKVFKKNKEPEFMMVPTQKQTYVVDKDTFKTVEYDYWMEMRQLIRDKYSKFTKKSCRHCHGSALEVFFQNKLEDMLIPLICRCVVKNHNKRMTFSSMEHKDSMSLLHSILDIPEHTMTVPEKPSETSKLFDIVDDVKVAEALVEEGYKIIKEDKT